MWSVSRNRSVSSQRSKLMMSVQYCVKNRDHCVPSGVVTGCGFTGSMVVVPLTTKRYLWTWPFGTATLTAQYTLSPTRGIGIGVTRSENVPITATSRAVSLVLTNTNVTVLNA